MLRFIMIFLILIPLRSFGNDYVKDLLITDTDSLLISQIPLDEAIVRSIQSKSINSKECSTLKCLDGYRVWKLRNDSLFLIQFRNCCGDNLVDKDSISILSRVFGTDELFCDWLTTKIYNQYGKLIKFRMDYSIYEFDRDFEINKGHLIDVKKYDNRKSKVFSYSHKQELMYEFWLKSINWDTLEKNNCDNGKLAILNFEVDTTGKPTKIKVLRGVNKVCDTELVRAVKRISEWDMYYVKGELLKIKWNVPIRLDRKWYEKQNQDYE